MRIWNRNKAVLFLAGFCMALMYNHCGGTHSMGGDSSSSGQYLQCLQIKESEFTRGYHSWLESNCAACHRTGGTGNGAFGDSLPNIAFGAFNIRGSDLIYERALDPNHQPGLTGPQHAGTLDPLQASYEQAEADYDACVAQVDDNGGAPLDPAVPQDAEFFTVEKVMGAGNNPTTLSWNLANEFESTGAPSLQGVTFSMSVQTAETETGSPYYVFSLPNLQAGASNIRVSTIEIKINGEIETSATTFKGINIIVGAGGAQDLTLTGMVVPRTPNATDTVSVGFGIIEETTEQAGIPAVAQVTFASLIAPTGVLGRNCLGCHSAAAAPVSGGGFNMTDYTAVTTVNNRVVPGNPAGSLIIQRMNGAGAQQMPPAPAVPVGQAQINQVQNWIQNGAPQ